MTDRVGRLLKPAEVADRLGVSRSKVYTLIGAGRLPTVRLTGSVRVPEVALDDLVVAITTGPKAAA
ncbi:MAG: DNA-binding protein [Chloroflexota bacterium]|nr:MAG: DNA-binding protein [Chloroflexota bacterium]